MKLLVISASCLFFSLGIEYGGCFGHNDKIMYVGASLAGLFLILTVIGINVSKIFKVKQ